MLDHRLQHSCLFLNDHLNTLLDRLNLTWLKLTFSYPAGFGINYCKNSYWRKYKLISRAQRIMFRTSDITQSTEELRDIKINQITQAPRNIMLPIESHGKKTYDGLKTFLPHLSNFPTCQPSDLYQRGERSKIFGFGYNFPN